jgi:hypothetical protein
MLTTVYFYAALIGGTCLAVQFVLMLLGIGDGDDAFEGSHGADCAGSHAGHEGGMEGHSGHGHGPLGGDHATGPATAHPTGNWFYEMLSLRTISAAVTFFGLTGKTALARGMHPMPALIISVIAGYGALVAVYWLFKQVFRLQNAGNENVRLAIGLPATVYVPIPGARAGVGKVMFRLQDRVVEYQAVTDHADRLATGENVVVEDVVNNDTVCVARLPEPVAG